MIADVIELKKVEKMSKKINISQSLIKDMTKYESGLECGLKMEHKWIKGQLIDLDSDVMNQGGYFEWLATNQLPKNGKEPVPEYLKDGKSLNAAYRQVESQANHFKKMVKEMGIEILSSGEKATKNGLEGTRDIKAKYKGKVITIDTKYSGLVHNEWEPMGWAALIDPSHRGHERQIEYHKIQAIQYKYIFGDDFYFWVFSSASGVDKPESKNYGENVFIKTEISEEEIEMHLNLAKYTSDRLNFYSKFGFEPSPSYNECQKCPLLDGCKSASRVQEPIIVKI
jgi:hypothetical protein